MGEQGALSLVFFTCLVLLSLAHVLFSLQQKKKNFLVVTFALQVSTGRKVHAFFEADFAACGFPFLVFFPPRDNVLQKAYMTREALSPRLRHNPKKRRFNFSSKRTSYLYYVVSIPARSDGCKGVKFLWTADTKFIECH